MLNEPETPSRETFLLMSLSFLRVQAWGTSMISQHRGENLVKKRG